MTRPRPDHAEARPRRLRHFILFALWVLACSSASSAPSSDNPNIPPGDTCTPLFGLCVAGSDSAPASDKACPVQTTHYDQSYSCGDGISVCCLPGGECTANGGTCVASMPDCSKGVIANYMCTSGGDWCCAPPGQTVDSGSLPDVALPPPPDSSVPDVPVGPDDSGTDTAPPMHDSGNPMHDAAPEAATEAGGD
jgi:hypothetical protein